MSEPDFEKLNETLTELQEQFARLGLRTFDRGSPTFTPFTPRTTIETKINKIAKKEKKEEDDEEDEKEGKKVTTKLPSINNPEFSGEDFESFLEDFERWMRLTGLEDEKELTKLDWLVECTQGKAKILVKKLVKDKKNLGDVLRGMSKLFPKLENDLTLRLKLEKVPQLPWIAETHQVAQLYVDLEDIMVKMSETAMSDQEKFILLTKKIHPKTFAELRSDRFFKRRTETLKISKKHFRKKQKKIGKKDILCR